MSEKDDALTTIRGWVWGGMTRSIADVVNELALNGHRRASNSVLSLLSDGEIRAGGFYKWQGFLAEHNQIEGYGEIPARRWQALQAGLAMPRDQVGAVPKVDLELISSVYGGSGELPVAKWDWRQSRFSTANVTGNIFSHDYSEEWFSAWEIEISPPGFNTETDTSISLPSPAIEVNAGGRPTALDWEAAALEMAGRYYRGDFKPSSIADVIAEIQKWAERVDGGPNENTVRPHAKRIFEAFKTWETDL